MVWCTACGGGSSKVTDTSIAINPDSISFNSRSNSAKAYTIEYPSTWLNSPTPDSTDKIEVLAAFNELREDSTDSFLENIILVTGELTHDAVLPSSFSNLQVISTSKETIGNHNAEIETGIFDLTSDLGETLNLAYMTITVESHGKLYGLQYMAELRRFKTYTEIAKRMVASWQIG